MDVDDSLLSGEIAYWRKAIRNSLQKIYIYNG